ncbi:MAG: hypothetical protein WC828_06675 [Thermoleophilia bacterium]|jgi:hypothetical protein
MDNSKLLNWGMAAGAVAILAALVGYLFFWSSDDTTACRSGMMGSGNSACMKDGGCDMMDGMSGMGDMMDGMSGMGGMMGGPTGDSSTPLTIDQASDAAKRYLDDYGNKDLKVKEVVEFTNSFYVRVIEQSSNSGALELVVNRNSGEVTSEPGPNRMWNTRYGSQGSSDSNGGMMDGGDGSMDGMMDGSDGSMSGMHEGMMDGSGGSMDGMMDGSDGSMSGMHDGMMDGGTCGMMGNTGGGSNTSANASATTDMPVTKAEARDRAQKYLDTQFPGAKAGEPDTSYGYYSVKVEKDGRTFGILSVNGDDRQIWYHAWLGAFLSGKQF